MPKYSKTVELPGRSAEEIYEKISVEVEKFLTKSALGDFEVRRFPEQCRIEAQSKWFSAVILCESQKIELEAHLSMLALAFRSKLDEGIERWLKKMG